MAKVFVVSCQDIEDTYIVGIYSTRKLALKAWNKERLRLIKRCEENLTAGYKNGYSGQPYEEQIKNLQCKNPNKLDNGMDKMPVIRQCTLNKEK